MEFLLTTPSKYSKIPPMNEINCRYAKDTPEFFSHFRLLYGLLSLLTLFMGMLIYLLFRDLNNIILFKWIPKPAFFETVLVPLQPSILTNLLKYHMPDMLWFISAILFIRFIWFYKIKMQTAYITCFYGITLVFETSQLSEKVPGTFDWFDLFFMGIGAFFEGLLYKLFIQRRFV